MKHPWVSFELPSRIISLFICSGLNELVVQTSVSSIRISDRLVGVEHNSDLGAEFAGRKVPGELGADETGLAVGGGDLTPDAFVVNAGLGVLGLVDESDALAVVEGGRLAVLAAVDVDKRGVHSLISLASLESHENSLGVKPTQSTS